MLKNLQSGCDAAVETSCEEERGIWWQRGIRRALIHVFLYTGGKVAVGERGGLCEK